MAKAKTHHVKSAPKKSGSEGFDIKLFDTGNPVSNYIFIGIILLAVMVFFGDGLFKGKIFASADNLSPFSFKTFLSDAKAQGVFPLWVPYIFLGMPSLASLTTGIPAIHNIFSYIWDNVNTAVAGDNLFFLTLPYYFVFGLSLYAYSRYKFKNNLIALYVALSGVFATGIIQLIIVGHHTKMMTIAFFPLIMLVLDLLIETDFKNKYRLILNFALLTILVYIQLHFHHIQMLFYSYMMIGIYTLYNVIFSIVKKFEVKRTIRAFVMLLVAVIFAVAMDADIIMSIKEYNKFSMRGQAGIENVNSPEASKNTPLSYDYATNWSFSPGEVLTFVMPYYYGFGNVDVKGQKENLYWGQMPFTDSPVYFGVVTLLLAVIGIYFFFRKNVFVQSLTVIIVFFLFLSFGRTFPLIYDLFFYYFPFFSSFRAPVMIHYYIDLAFVILAGFGLKASIEAVKENSEKFKKLCFVLFGIGGLMFLISIIGFQGSYKDSVLSGPKVAEYKQQGANPQQITQYFSKVAETAYENVISDLRLHSVFILAVVALAYLYSQKKLKLNVFLAGVVFIGVFDILNISAKTLHWDDKSQKDNYFAETDYSKWLLAKEPDTYKYRIAQFAGGKLTTSNNLAYYRLHSFNGYHGAKIRIYQDAVDVAGGENPFLLGLADVKYVISDKPVKDTTGLSEVYRGSNIIYQNRFFIPRAYFVNEIKIETGINILRNIKEAKFNPLNTAFVEKDINQKIDRADSNATAVITKFDIHNIEYDVNATGTNYLVLNEVYYPAGWKAYIDGKETDIYKTNYLFRGIVIPAGKHKVEFRFYPEAYHTGKAISTGANIIIVLTLLAGIGGTYISRKKKEEKESDIT